MRRLQRQRVEHWSEVAIWTRRRGPLSGSRLSTFVQMVRSVRVRLQCDYCVTSIQCTDWSLYRSDSRRTWRWTNLPNITGDGYDPILPPGRDVGTTTAADDVWWQRALTLGRWPLSASAAAISCACSVVNCGRRSRRCGGRPPAGYSRRL